MSEFLPGSPGKKEVLARRLEDEEDLFQEGDVLHDPRRVLNISRLRNGRDRIDPERPEVEVEPALCDAKTERQGAGPGTSSRASVLGVCERVRLGERLSQLRRARRVSLACVQMETGVERSYLWKLEQGKKADPGLAVLWSLADFYKVSVDWLIGRE